MAIRIALDDGHGMQTAGKRTPTLPNGLKSKDTGKNFMHENEFNRAVVKYLKTELIRCGFEVLEVAPTDEDTTLTERVKKSNNWKAHLYLSVHANANTAKWGDWGGIETFTWGSGESLRIGKILHKYLMMGTAMRDRGVKNGSHLYVIKNTTAPAVLIEAGFMDSKHDYKYLLQDEYRKETAIELARGICEAFKVKYVPAQKTSTNTTAPKSETWYRVVTGSFENKATAEKRVQELKAKGYDSFIIPYTK